MSPEAAHPRQPAPRRRLHWEHLAGALLVVVWLALALRGAAILTPTSDEVPHIGAGIAQLEYGDLRFNPEHPPLLKLAAALPLWVFDRPRLVLERDGLKLGPWIDGDQWHFGYHVLYRCVEDPVRALFLARLVPIAIGLLGGVVAWLWGASFGGRRCGLAAMALLLFYPEYLGHARYVTLDVPTLVSCAWIAWLAYRHHRRPTARGGMLLVVVGTIGALVKLPVAIFAVVAMGLLLGLSFARRSRTRPLRVGILIAALALSGLAAQWCATGFTYRVDPHPPHQDSPNTYARPSADRWPGGTTGALTSMLARHRIVPEATIGVLNHTKAFEGRIQYLLGDVQRVGWYHYFLVTIALKTPLPYFLLLAAGAWVAVTEVRRRPLAAARVTLLLIPFVVLFALTAISRVSIGHRHILFLYFPWCVLGGVWLARWTREGGARIRRIAAGLLLGVVALAVVRSHPNEATYFNEFAGGGPEGGMLFLRDSNTDWGQSLAQLSRRLGELQTGPVNLAMFGPGRPEAYGIEGFNFILPNYPFAMGMPPAVPPDPARWSAISVNCLDDAQALHPGEYLRPHDEVVGSFLLYRPMSGRVR